MTNISENSVFTAMESYEKGINVKSRIIEWSERLRILREEVSDLAVELIARYQPVASDLRMIRSCTEISYGFSRFGRYSYDIADLLETMGFAYNDCDKTAVLEMAKKVREMILLSVGALETRDKNAVSKLYEMDDTVDTLYRKYLQTLVIPKNEREQVSPEETDPRCYGSAILILKYLERISDHACYVGDSIKYIVTGISRPRR